MTIIQNMSSRRGLPTFWILNVIPSVPAATASAGIVLSFKVCVVIQFTVGKLIPGDTYAQCLHVSVCLSVYVCQHNGFTAMQDTVTFILVDICVKKKNTQLKETSAMDPSSTCSQI